MYSMIYSLVCHMCIYSSVTCILFADDSVKVVKPKDPQMRVASSSAGIQSPKPNGPGFLLGASTGGGFRAFSPYTSRSGEYTGYAAESL